MVGDRNMGETMCFAGLAGGICSAGELLPCKIQMWETQLSCCDQSGGECKEWDGWSNGRLHIRGHTVLALLWHASSRWFALSETSGS